jgi:hypothetical protein
VSRRRSLPGADELFRATAASGAATLESDRPAPEPAGLALAPLPAPDDDGPAPAAEPAQQPSTDHPTPVRRPVRRRSTAEARRPSGRERHDEKITVYVSAEELLDLEHARLTLRGDHGLAVDRGRIVREALAVVLADLDAKGESSILVRRLRGR